MIQVEGGMHRHTPTKSTDTMSKVTFTATVLDVSSTSPIKGIPSIHIGTMKQENGVFICSDNAGTVIGYASNHSKARDAFAAIADAAEDEAVTVKAAKDAKAAEKEALTVKAAKDAKAVKAAEDAKAAKAAKAAK